MGTDPSKESAEVRGLKRIDGQSYFALIGEHRRQCKTTSIARLPSLGKRAPMCFRNLGGMLALLDQLACCAWGCPGTEEGHLTHRLVGRAVSNGNAAVEFALIGQYDEALANARAIGEAANLLSLFAIDRPTMEHWSSLDRRERWAEYHPARVRQKVEASGRPVLVKERDYRLLSEHASHVTPMTQPNAIGVARRPSLGGIYREDLFLLSLNEIAWAVGVLSLPTVELLGPAKDAEAVLKAGKTLLESVGGVRLSNLHELLKLIA